MTILGRLLAGLAVWFGVGAPLAVLVGRWLRLRSGPPPQAPATAAGGPLPAPPLARAVRGRPRLSLAGVASVLTILVLGVGAPAAASEAGPSSVLWPLRVTVENVRLVLTRQPAERARLHARYAERQVGALDGLLGEDGDLGLTAAVARLRFHTDGLARLLADQDAAVADTTLQVRRLAERSHGMRQQLDASECVRADVCDELTRTASVARDALAAEPAGHDPGGRNPVAGDVADQDAADDPSPVVSTSPVPPAAPADTPASPSDQPSEPDVTPTEPAATEPAPSEDAAPPVEASPEADPDDGTGSPDGSGESGGPEESREGEGQGAPPPPEVSTEPRAKDLSPGVGRAKGGKGASTEPRAKDVPPGVERAKGGKGASTEPRAKDVPPEIEGAKGAAGDGGASAPGDGG